MNVRAIIVDDIRSEAGRQPGAIEIRLRFWDEGEGGIAFRCPCGCGQEGYLPIRPAGTARTNYPEWEWDGDQVAPTCTPSILQLNSCRWHGYLTDGEFRPC